MSLSIDELSFGCPRWQIYGKHLQQHDLGTKCQLFGEGITQKYDINPSRASHGSHVFNKAYPKSFWQVVTGKRNRTFTIEKHDDVFFFKCVISLLMYLEY